MVFSMPSGPIKCPSAPLKILNLADDILRRSGVREVSRVIFITPYSNLFVVNGYAQALAEVAKNGEQKYCLNMKFPKLISAIRSFMFQHARKPRLREILKQLNMILRTSLLK